VHDPDELPELTALLREGDPAQPLPEARTRMLRRELLAKCEAADRVEPATTARPPHRQRAWLLTAFSGAAAVGVFLAVLVREQPEKTGAVVAVSPRTTRPEAAASFPKVTAVNERPAPPVEAPVPPRSFKLVRQSPPPVLAKTARSAGSLASVPPKRERPVTPSPAPPRERLVIDADGPSSDLDPGTRVVSLSLSVTGSPYEAGSNVAIVRTTSEEKLP
jgi:hypothetical protein